MLDQDSGAPESAPARPGELLRLVAENLDVVFYVTAPRENRFLYRSAAFTALFGPAAADLSENLARVVDLVHEHDRARVEEALERQLSGEPTRIEYRVVVGDGSTRWIHDHAVPLRQGHRDVVVGVAQDVTADRERDIDRAFLADASALLASHLEPDRVLRELAHLIVPRMADWCRIHVLDDEGGVVAAEPLHRDPAKAELLREMERRFPPRRDLDAGVYRVIHSGEPDLYPDIPDEVLVAASQGPEHLGLARALGLRSAMIVPLRTRAGVLGAISFASDGTRRTYDEVALRRAGELAERAALALENARLHQEARRARLDAEAERRRALDVLESIRDGFFVVDRQWRIVYANPVSRESEPVGSRPIDGAPLWREFPWLVGSAFEAPARRAMETRQAGEMEAYLEEVDAWFHARFYPSPEGLSVLYRDVSARYRDEARRQLLDHASTLFSSTTEYEVTLQRVAELAVPELADYCALHLIGEDGGVRRVAAAQVDGADADAWRDLPMVHQSEGGPDGALLRVLATGEPFLSGHIDEERLARALGDRPHTLELTTRMQLRSALLVPLRARGRSLGALALYQGPSGRRYEEADLAWAGELATRAALAVDNARLLREAQVARRVAESASQAKSQFLAVMSHELRTPLNAVVGYADLLDTGVGGALGEKQLKYVARIRESAGLLLSLIEEILNLSRIEAGKVDIVASEVDARSLVTAAVALVEPAAREKALPLETVLPAEAVRMRSDVGKIRQILLNLLANAVKFTDEGRVETRLECAGDHAVFRVRDTGPGVPPEKHEEVFQPFARLASKEDQRRGTGLGLAVVRRYARLLGGDVTIESPPGGGCVFVLRLPFEAPSGDPSS